MRIGMVLDKTFPPDPRVENQALYLIAQGYDVFLFCLQYEHKKVTVEKYKGIHVVRYTSNQLTYKLSALAYTVPFYKWIMQQKIKHFVKQYLIDVVHTHDMQIASAVKSALQKSTIPIVLDLHENRPEIMQFYPHLKTKWGKLLISTKRWKQKEEKFVNTFDKTIVVTQEAKEELLSRVKQVPENISVVSNGVAQSFYKNVKVYDHIINKYKDKYVLLYIGDTAERRGLLTAIKAVSKLTQKIPNIQLVVVGKSSEDVILKRKVRELFVDKQVSFEGWQSPGLFASYLSVANIGISPLLANLHHHTTYANKLFQYMSFEIPLLLSDVLAQKNMIDNYGVGLSHKAGSKTDFAEKVMELFENPSRSKKMGERGKYMVEHDFSWQEKSKPLLHLYQELEKSIMQ